MPELFSKIFSDINTATAALTIVFSLLALITSIFVAIRSNMGLAVKVLGSLFVMAICFASNNAFVYAIGIFIVATLVTELEFLEKLAAIVWNRKEYWDYLKGKATPKEIQEKIKQEIEGDSKEIETSVNLNLAPARAEEIIKEAQEFSRKVLKAFRASSGPLKITTLEEETRLHGEGHRYILDGIAHSSNASYIIEVKSIRPRHLMEPLYKLDHYMNAYRRYAEERGGSKPVRGILVLPTGYVERDWIRDTPILKFNGYDGTFMNINAVKNQFPDWDWR